MLEGYAGDDVFNVTKVNTKKITNGKISDGLSGSEDVVCMERNIRNRGHLIAVNKELVSLPERRTGWL